MLRAWAKREALTKIIQVFRVDLIKIILAFRLEGLV